MNNFKNDSLEYADEDILKQRKLKQKEDLNTLKSGFILNEKLVEFETWRFYEETLEIVLPKHFVDMPVNMANLKYPSVQRPQIIKTSLDTTVNFTFNYFPNQTLNTNQIDMASKQFKMLFEKIYPTAQFFNQERITNKNEVTISWLDYQTSAIDGMVYNFVYFFPLHGKLLQGMFNCFVSNKEEWSPVVLLILDTINSLDKKGA